MINISSITDGKMNGKTVWICDLRYNDYSDKPIRNVRPIKVLVRDNQKTKRNIYYSKSHFIGFNKKGLTIESKVLAVFDTTGHRSFTGVALNCFTTEKECKNYYIAQSMEAIIGLEEHKIRITSTIDAKVKEINEIIKENK